MKVPQVFNWVEHLGSLMSTYNVGPIDQGAYGTGLFHSLPFLDQENLYKIARPGGAAIWGAWNNNVYTRPISVFQCPSNSSSPSDGSAADNNGTIWGVSSYGGNVQVFSLTDNRGTLINPQGNRRLLEITDQEMNQLIADSESGNCCLGLFVRPRRACHVSSAGSEKPNLPFQLIRTLFPIPCHIGLVRVGQSMEATGA